MSDILVRKGYELMNPPVKEDLFRRQMRNYIGKHRRKSKYIYSTVKKRGKDAERDKHKFTPLQTDVHNAYGFYPSLDDPVYNPSTRKLNTLWVKIRFEKLGSKNDQANLKILEQEFINAPELFDEFEDGHSVLGTT